MIVRLMTICVITLFIYNVIDIPLSMSTLTLIKWKDPHGREQKFRLINRVSAKWIDFGYRLKRNTNQLEGWERECLLNADRCWCKVMSHWLKEDGTPDYPTTWRGVFCLLEDVECLEVAQGLQKALDSVIVPPPPPPAAPCDMITPEALTSDTVAADTAESIPAADTAEMISDVTLPQTLSARHQTWLEGEYERDQLQA